MSVFLFKSFNFFIKINASPTAAIVNLNAIIQIGPTELRLSFTTTNANPQIQAVKSNPHAAKNDFLFIIIPKKIQGCLKN